jgi:serine/threonine protein phosphatase 1
MTDQPRTITISDIHGHSQALNGIIAAIDPKPEDTLIFLGDYVDRGPDSKGVIEHLIDLKKRFNVVALMGNHEQMMLGAKGGRSDLRFWTNLGGRETLESYGNAGDLRLVPWEHLQFLKGLPLFYKTETHFFIHANYDPNRPLDRQDSAIALWKHLNELPPPHISGKIAVVGHTPQMSGQIIDLPHLKCIDTGCGYGGLLTALDLGSGRIWQVDELGRRW